MPTEDTDRFSGRPNDSSRVTNSKLSPQTSSHVNDVPQHQTVLQMPGVEQEIRLLIKKMVVIVCRLSSSPMIHMQGLSQKATSIILQSWRKGTTKQYSFYIKRWTKYCHQKQIGPVSATFPQPLDFLAELFESGIGYSGINTARSALSSVLKPVDGITFGAQESVKRFLKGVYEARPSSPRYAETWDMSKVLNYLKTISLLQIARLGT